MSKRTMFYWLIALGILILMGIAVYNNQFFSEGVQTQIIVAGSCISTYILLFWTKSKFDANAWVSTYNLTVGSGILIIFTMTLFFVHKSIENSGRIIDELIADSNLSSESCNAESITEIRICKIYEKNEIENFKNEKQNNSDAWDFFKSFLGVFQGGLVSAFLYAWATSARHATPK